MTPRRQAQSRPASPADARAYLSKAREFLRAASDSDSLELGNLIAATGNAVHAGIGAADAIAAARHLRRLLPLKKLAEYDRNPVSPTEASGTVEAARRMVAIAQNVVGSLTDQRC